MSSPEDILTFWFVEHGPPDWFAGRLWFDERIRQRFTLTHRQVASQQRKSWRSSVEGSLAEIIVLDQFSRHLYRQTKQAFAFDGLALQRAKALVKAGLDRQLGIEERRFAYMPYMHAECVEAQQASVQLFGLLGEKYKRNAQRHYDIIQQFGRYPHRNAVLERQNTDAEEEFLTADHRRFGQ